LEELYYNRNTTIRMALARAHVQTKLRDEHPEIPHYDEPIKRFVIRTEGAGIVDDTTPPCGVIFTDGSFLTIYEEWSKTDNELLRYSYHYQRGKVYVRYDMDMVPREGIPQWHVQFSGIEKIHSPCGGRVGIDQVLDMITQQFL
jgi:hypothetical protein